MDAKSARHRKTTYGHKNVIFEGLADSEVARRPIGADGLGTQAMREFIPRFPPALAFANLRGTFDNLNFNAVSR